MGLTSGRAGQAAIELITSLLLLLLVVAGMIHVANMGKASLYLHAALRGRAGERAMDEMFVGRTPRYISDWRAGADRVRYTADDTPVYGGALGVAYALTEASARTADDWSHVTPDTLLPVSAARLHQADIGLLSFSHAEETIYVELSSIIRQLIYDRPEVAIKESVWLPQMGGLLY